MNISIIAIGRKKSEYEDMIHEYIKRIVAPFSCRIELVEPLGLDNPEQCKIKESEKLASKIKTGDYVVILDETGRSFTTEEFSKWMGMRLQDSHKRIVFVIGGAYGIHENLKSGADLVLQLGSFTLPHELARLVLIEQLYRATNLLGGGKYHHK